MKLLYPYRSAFSFYAWVLTIQNIQGLVTETESNIDIK